MQLALWMNSAKCNTVMNVVLLLLLTVMLTLVGIQCYQLESVCRLRKYLSFVELGLSFLTSRVIFVSGWSELVKAQVISYF